MMTILYDQDKKYETCIKTILRAYNAKHSDNKTYQEYYAYLTNKGELTNIIKVSLFWDWLSLDQMVYQSVSALKTLISYVAYKLLDKAQGIKVFTSVCDQKDDLIQAGFKLIKTVKIHDTLTYYYLDYDKSNAERVANHACHLEDTSNDRFQEIIKQAKAEFNKKYNITVQESSLIIGALDNQRCIGGIHCYHYGDVLYISRLAVLEQYRKLSVGKTLMVQVETYAKSHNIKVMMLGTTGFQAKGFYEKCGFKAVFSRENHPIGYASYTMLKRL